MAVGLCLSILLGWGFGVALAVAAAPAAEIKVFVRPVSPDAGASPHLDPAPRMACELRTRAMRILLEHGSR